MRTAQAVKLPGPLVDRLRDAAAIHSRSIAGQAEHWIKLGRLVEVDPRFGVLKIEQALRGELSPDDLSVEQQEAYLDRVADSHWDDASPQAAAAFAEMVDRGDLVGYASEASDELVTMPPKRRR